MRDNILGVCVYRSFERSAIIVRHESGRVRCYHPSPRALWILERVLNAGADNGTLRVVIELMGRMTLAVYYHRQVQYMPKGKDKVRCKENAGALVYRWATPVDWLAHVSSHWWAEALRAELLELARRVDSEILHELYGAHMADDRYYEPIEEVGHE